MAIHGKLKAHWSSGHTECVIFASDQLAARPRTRTVVLMRQRHRQLGKGTLPLSTPSVTAIMHTQSRNLLWPRSGRSGLPLLMQPLHCMVHIYRPWCPVARGPVDTQDLRWSKAWARQVGHEFQTWNIESFGSSCWNVAASGMQLQQFSMKIGHVQPQLKQSSNPCAVSKGELVCNMCGQRPQIDWEIASFASEDAHAPISLANRPEKTRVATVSAQSDHLDWSNCHEFQCACCFSNILAYRKTKTEVFNEKTLRFQCGKKHLNSVTSFVCRRCCCHFLSHLTHWMSCSTSGSTLKSTCFASLNRAKASSAWLLKILMGEF